MKVPSVKGTRDLYPEDFRPVRRIFDAWRKASLRHGFEEFEGPTLEMLDLYREKSGDELVGQLFRLTDTGGRELALRPEMTPTLARMVAARINALSKPIKWFCIPKLFRGENVQRGRLREFFQWNIDVIGTADVVADAECILVGVEALRDLGLTSNDIAVHISHRKLFAAILGAAGIADERHASAFAIIDKAGKAPEEVLRERWDAQHGDNLTFDALNALLGVRDVDSLQQVVSETADATEAMESAFDETRRLFSILTEFDIADFCCLNLKVVRGLAYYTGPVFEFFDRGENERAICGGGRYDDLLGRLGKSKEPAVGFGMGDVVLSLILEERGLRDDPGVSQTVYVIDASDAHRGAVHRAVADLRRFGIQSEFSYSHQPIPKQLKAANKRQCAFAVIFGEETESSGVVQIKNLADGSQQGVALRALMADPRSYFGHMP